MATLADPFAAPIGILAGNGRFPGEIARAIRARGGDVVVLGIDTEASADLQEFGLIRVGWGEVGRILRTFRQRGCRELVIVGGVTRPDLARIRPDMGVVWNLPEIIRIISSGGDDGVLSALVRLIEARGFTVVSPADVAPEIVVGAGPMGEADPSSADIADMLLGSSIVKALGPFDVGQGVIVSDGRIEAIEAAEGTDRMIRRVAEQRSLAGSADQRRGILIKRPKPSQEMRVDLPAIGPDTVSLAAEAGLKGIAVLAGQTLVADRAEVERRARSMGVFVYGFTDQSHLAEKRADDPWPLAHVAPLTRRRPTLRAIADARRGAATLASLGEAARAGAVIVNRGHVLGIETEGNQRGLYRRADKLTPWSRKRWLFGGGVAVLGPDCDIYGITCDAAAAGSISGVALMRAPGSKRGDDLVAQLSKTNAFVIALAPDGGSA